MVKYISIIVVLICLVLPFFFWGDNKEQFTPFVDVFISVFLTGSSFVLGWIFSTKESEKHAMLKWMPMAKSCIEKLLTLELFVLKLVGKTKESSDDIQKSDNIACIKTLVKTDFDYKCLCYDNIINQIGDTIEDWHRFVVDNCQGNECLEVDDLISNKRSKS